jgi:hypothetical protein
MATLSEYEKLTIGERQNRNFREDFKCKKVNELNRNLTTIAALSRVHQVTRAAICKWIYKYNE